MEDDKYEDLTDGEVLDIVFDKFGIHYDPENVSHKKMGYEQWSNKITKDLISKIDMAIKYKKILDSAHEENPVYKFLVFYDLLDNWFKDPKLKTFTDYEDIFYHVSKTIKEYEKSDYAKDYTQSELTCIIQYLENKFEHKVAKIWKVKNDVEIS
jgi:hypothetical protein